MAAHQNGSEANHSQSLKHGLKSRHLTMISIAGVIGGSFFFWSARIFYLTRPLCCLSSAFRGLCVLVLLRLVVVLYVLLTVSEA